MSAHDSFVVWPISWVLWLAVLILESALVISHLVEATSTATIEIIATSLIEVSASPVVLVVASSVLLTSSEATSAPAAIAPTSSGPLIAIIPLHTFQSKLHKLLWNWIVRLSQFGISVSEMAPLSEDAVIVSFEMSAPIRFVFLVDLVFAVLTNLLGVEVLLLLELVRVLGLSHVHLIHLLLLLHHLHLVWHHAWLHLHLHVVTWHRHIVHLIRCVHLQLI